MSRSAYWAVARSEEVTKDKPLAVDIGDQPVVLWRDAGGIVRALEDRCPHRRAPLSLGCIKPDGRIQCGYHGWIYDGETGRLKEIPNMKDKQKFPPLYKAIAFAVTEADGFVRVSLEAGAVAPAASGKTMALSGTVHIGLGHAHYVAALFDDPGLLLTLRGVDFTPYLTSELHIENGRLVMERDCQWSGPHWPAPFSADFPASLWSATDPVTGETELVLRDRDFNEYLRAVLAPIPAARGVTAVRWRAELGADRHGLRGLMMGLGDPVSLHASVDAAALRVLRPSASLHGEDLRAQIAKHLLAQIAPGTVAAAAA